MRRIVSRVILQKKKRVMENSFSNKNTLIVHCEKVEPSELVWDTLFPFLSLRLYP